MPESVARRRRSHEPLFEHDQHCDHFADALACQILEIAGLINTNNVVLHILRKAMVVVVLRTEARARAQSGGHESRGDVADLSRHRHRRNRRRNQRLSPNRPRDQSYPKRCRRRTAT